MDITDTDHIELYVGDARMAADQLCAQYGFRVYGQGGPETGLAGQRSVLLGQRDVRVLLTSGLSGGHRASRYVAQHGDGVAVVAFGCTDAAAAFAEAVAAGATPVSPPQTVTYGHSTVVFAEVSGFGDVTHRLIQRDRTDPSFLPGLIAMPGDVSQLEAGGGLLHQIDHAAVCLPAGELDATVAYYERVFGFTMIFQEYIEVGEQGMQSKVVQSPSGGVTFTLIQPDISRRAGQIDDFLAWHEGAGVQHIAFSTHDIVAAVRTLGERGVEFAQTPGSYYDMLAGRLGETDVPIDDLRPLGILVDRDHWGQMYQIFAKSTHIRRTYFNELIDRHGARTFGTSNIPALYAAKERELAAVRDITHSEGTVL
ncbi:MULTISPECIES: 4-hydroxyphenylpyruvate dioxygenase [Dactylosporangium]|uniref:4-hydroxyphenylpyruvate dioxygenase n=2 Tax=Dactylosporangium TaxID=35753 RepID=A0A9W6NLY1_9ACTN|nr:MULTISPECIES: 4-hydroxyphenylpyruvate dioxygenase [Dactylosporangium]UAB99055.1 4-hydroxyphenylpyruvate dioxygenase [Dactylosporangium vinaceum]UWZ47297.1 4-hydroxyphenylpyruvate dioxygenase [Dactylosporangium matsuzakiense]GLL01347.1 4-hydroxyphenylpyruvate dioxygenase [Dactylosporangium matsuzakiense]